MAAEPRVGIFLAGYGDGGAKGREMRRAASTSATTNTRAAPKNAARNDERRRARHEKAE
jgi:hypothetical protein